MFSLTHLNIQFQAGSPFDDNKSAGIFLCMTVSIHFFFFYCQPFFPWGRESELKTPLILSAWCFPNSKYKKRTYSEQTMEHFAIKDKKVRGKANEILLKIIGLEHEKIFMMFLSKIFKSAYLCFSLSSHCESGRHWNSFLTSHHNNTTSISHLSSRIGTCT